MKNLARRAALAAAVPAVTALDAWRCRGRDTADLASDVSVCVKTFERPAVMARFVRELEKTGGTGGSQIGTNTAGAVPESKTWQPPTARGLDLNG